MLNERNVTLSLFSLSHNPASFREPTVDLYDNGVTIKFSVHLLITLYGRRRNFLALIALIASVCSIVKTVERSVRQAPRDVISSEKTARNARVSDVYETNSDVL